MRGGFTFAARNSRAALPSRLRAPYRLLSGKYFVDELYAAVIVRPLLWISTRVLWHGSTSESSMARSTAWRTAPRTFGDRLRHLNSGNTRTYATWVVFGVVLLTIVLVWMAG